jgi:hypothetical protein
LAKELLGENCGKNSSRSHHDTRAKGPTTLDFSVITLFNTQTVMVFSGLNPFLRIAHPIQHQHLATKVNQVDTNGHERTHQ